MAKLEISNAHVGAHIMYDDNIPPHIGAGIRVELASNDANHFNRVIVDGETSHRIGDIVTQMHGASNGTHYYSDVCYELLMMLDAAWVEQNRITRETFRF